MQHIIGISRQQVRFSSLEDTISPDNQVRFIVAFVEYVDRSKLNFAVKTLNTKTPLVILSKLYDNSIVPANDRFQLVRRGGFNTGFIVRLAAATKPYLLAVVFCQFCF